jgi:hypothetical protein
MKRFVRSILLAVVIQVLTPAITFAAGSLGIGVSILPSGDTGGANLGNNNQLWFSMQPGQTLSREFTVSSSGNINQKIDFQLLGLQIIDGVERVDPQEISAANKWATFTPSTVILKPRTSTRVKLSFNVPAGTEFGRYDGFLHVVAEGVDSSTTSSKAKVQAVIKNAVAFDQKFWLGVGDGKYLTTDFEMKSIRGIKRGDAKFIQIEMKNLGGTPIGPEGTIDLQDAVFAKNHVGPLSFGTATVLPGKARWAEVEVPSEVNDGKWKIFVTANQGNITKTKMFEEDIKFVEEGSGLHLPWQMILIIFFLGLLIFGIRMVRTPSKKIVSKVKSIEFENAELDLNKLSLEELEAILAARLGDKPKKAKKSAAKRPVKTTTKKVAKKAPAKNVARKAPIKKTAKKAVKKSPAKSSNSKR